MADQKGSALTPFTPIVTDMFYGIDDPAGTPVSGNFLISALDTLLSSTVQVLSNKTLTLPQINDTSADHQYIFGVSELVADRTVTLPLLTGNDTFVFAGHPQTLVNKVVQLSDGSAAAPSLAFQDAALNWDTGFFLAADDHIEIAIAGVSAWHLDAAAFGSEAMSGPHILNETATATNPVYTVNGDPDSGQGWAGANMPNMTAGGVEVTRFNTAASGVNYLDITPSATGADVIVATAGTDTNIDLALAPKGAGNLVLNAPQLGGMLDVNGQAIGDGTLELLSFVETGSAINEFTITNAAIGTGPILSATGDDTNIDINITPKGTGGVILPPGAAATPAIGWTDTGFYESTADEISISNGGSQRWLITQGLLGSITNGGGTIKRTAGTLTSPAFYRTGDSNTGFSWDGADEPCVVAGGRTAVIWREAAANVIFTTHTDPAITAGTTQTQAGGFQLLSSRNVVTTVANANDTVVMPLAASGIDVLVINRGANTMRIYPGVGDDIGTGVDTLDTIVAGANKHYFADDATTWSTI